MYRVVCVLMVLCLINIPVVYAQDYEGKTIIEFRDDTLNLMGPATKTNNTPFAQTAINVIKEGNLIRTHAGQILYGSYRLDARVDKYFGITNLKNNGEFLFGYSGTNGYRYIQLHTPHTGAYTDITIFNTNIGALLSETEKGDIEAYGMLNPVNPFNAHIYTINGIKYVIMPAKGCQKVVYFNTVNNNNSTVVTLPTVNGQTVRCWASAIWRGRLWILGTRGEVVFSSATNIMDFTVGSTAGGVFWLPTSLDLNDTKIHTATGMFVLRDNLYIFTPQGIYIINGDMSTSSDFAIRRISTHIPRSIASYNDEIYGLIDNNIYVFDGVSFNFLTSLPRFIIDSFYISIMDTNFKAYNNRQNIIKMDATSRFIIINNMAYDKISKQWGFYNDIMGHNGISLTHSYFLETSTNNYIMAVTFDSVVHGALPTVSNNSSADTRYQFVHRKNMCSEYVTSWVLPETKSKQKIKPFYVELEYNLLNIGTYEFFRDQNNGSLIFYNVITPYVFEYTRGFYRNFSSSLTPEFVVELLTQNEGSGVTTTTLLNETSARSAVEYYGERPPMRIRRLITPGNFVNNVAVRVRSNSFYFEIAGIKICAEIQ